MYMENGLKHYTDNELKEILYRHRLWTKGEKDGQRADLSYSYLQHADMYDAWLPNIILHHSDLRNAQFGRACLEGADLSYCNLGNANFSDAELNGINFHGADLRFADFSDSCVIDASLPMGTGAIGLKMSEESAKNLAAVFCALECDGEDFQKMRKILLPFAEESYLYRFKNVR